MATKNTDKAKSKLIAELNKLISHVPADVRAEMLKTIEVIKQKGYLIPDDDEQTERAERIRKKAEITVVGRKRYAPYENMGFSELTMAQQHTPEIKNEFVDNWQFIKYIAKIFPDSPARELARKQWPADYPQTQASEQKKDEEIKSQPEKLSAKAKTIAILVEHPDWSDTKIAKEAGINRTTLYDYPEFKAARKMQKQNKSKMPRGSKDNEGNVEAIDE